MPDVMRIAKCDLLSVVGTLVAGWSLERLCPQRKHHIVHHPTNCTGRGFSRAQPLARIFEHFAFPYNVSRSGFFLGFNE